MIDIFKTENREITINIIKCKITVLKYRLALFVLFRLRLYLSMNYILINSE